MIIDADLRLALQRCEQVLVFTGAGVSAQSGLSTFRDALTGLWARFDPSALATREAFRRDPALVWGWYEWRRTLALKAQPNAAHRAIAELSALVPKLTLVTQNVDDLHERAGSVGVIHLHGSLNTPRCFACARPASAALPVPAEPAEGRHLEPPRCTHCGGKLRPGVVWFGENLPAQALRQAFAAAKECDLLLSVGTSGVVEPAAQIPEVAWHAGATVVHINLEPRRVRSEREFCLTADAGDGLAQLVVERLKANPAL